MAARSLKKALPLDIAFNDLLTHHAASAIPDSLSDEEIVNLVVRFANSPTAEDAYRVFAREAEPTQQRELAPDDHYWDFAGMIEREPSRAGMRLFSSAHQFNEEVAIDDQCRRVRKLMCILVEPGYFSQKVFDELANSASRQAQFPIFEIQEGIVRRRYRYWASTLATMMDYALILMLDPKHPFGRLCRCQLPSCATFFLANHVTGGRARTKYCTPLHALQAHDAQGPRRAEKSRRDRAHKKQEDKAASVAHIAGRVARAKAR
jgi:hypothetical protein